MRRLLDQMFGRPTQALASSVAMLGQQVKGGQMFDAIVSRIVHALSQPSRRERRREEEKAWTEVIDDHFKGGGCG
jgi:hypothetical protein